MWSAAGGGGGRVFESSYRVYPVSFIDKTQLENGDKVILPPSALDRLASLRIDYPMLFQISNPKEKKTSHCGVLEFVADEGHAYIPYWMMQNLLLTEGDLVKFRSISLAKGTYVKLRPHTSDFLDISNPKAVLEMTLRNYSCLTKDDTVLVNYNNKRYFIDIVETQPGDAITIIETDCEVDFAPPLDYDEAQFKKPKTEPATVVKGAGAGGPLAAAGTSKGAEEAAGENASTPSFTAFAGKGNRLDGKPQTSPVPIAIPSPSSKAAPLPSSSSGGRAGSLGKRAAGKLVFGRDASGKSANPDLPKPPPLNTARGGALLSRSKNEDEKKVEDEEATPTFQAFSGKSYKLT